MEPVVNQIVSAYESGMTLQEVADSIGRSVGFVHTRLERAGVSRRRQGPNNKMSTETGTSWGDGIDRTPKPQPSFSERFWLRVDRNGPVPMNTYRPVPGRCWIWEGAVNNYGYGLVGIGNNRRAMAHRLAYEELVGEITEETLDHLCLTKLCVNPDHLEPVSIGENYRRGLEMREICKNGLHPIDGAGECQPCKKESGRRARRKMI